MAVDSQSTPQAWRAARTAVPKGLRAALLHHYKNLDYDTMAVLLSAHAHGPSFRFHQTAPSYCDEFSVNMGEIIGVSFRFSDSGLTVQTWENIKPTEGKDNWTLITDYWLKGSVEQTAPALIEGLVGCLDPARPLRLRHGQWALNTPMVEESPFNGCHLTMQ